jgi:streptogramin lyase
MRTVGNSKWFLAVASAALALTAASGLVGGVATAQKAAPLQGMATLSGTVTADKPFKAARVYLDNVDKHIMYMVYTSGGAFRAVALFPGTYELVVKGQGLESERQKLVVKAGDNPAVKAAMHGTADPNQYPSSVDPDLARAPNGVLPPKQRFAMAGYEEIYPVGPGRVVLETLCMNCHGENFFAMQSRSPAGWRTALDYMMGKNLIDKEKHGLGEGVLAGSASHVRFGIQDRKDVLEYLTKNFGLDKKPRAVKPDVEMPLDEAQLGKAQYIEYYAVAGKEDGQASTAPSATASNSESVASGSSGVRLVMQVQIDNDGNRWGVERGVPSRLTKLDPRTGEQKSWDLPDKRAGVHDMVMDRRGFVWVLEFSRNEAGEVDAMGYGSELTSRLLGFNMKTEKWEFTIDPDPDNVIRQTKKGPLMGGTVDSKGNVYAHWMLTGGLAKYDVTTGKATTFRIPTPGAVPYGEAIDPFDNVWVAEWNGGKMGRFNTKTETWTEFIPPIFPANFRRGPQADPEGNIWVGIWAAGNRPAKIAKLDQKTGNWTLWDVPYRGSQPYETSIDKDGNVWFPDTAEARPDRGTAIGRFNPRTKAFTFYPRPQQIADSTRVYHAADGSVHYTARYGAAKDTSAFGVLYPDKDRITSLASLPLNGPPQYSFKLTGPKSTN